MAANNDCEGLADGSNFRSNGCAFSGDDCPIKGKKVRGSGDDALDMKFFAEQKNDANKKWKDEMIHFHNPASGRSNEGGNGNTKNLLDRQNVHDGHVSGDDFITQNPKAGKSDRAENCTQWGGKITGIGPSCDVGERGQGDLHQCVFTKIADCEARRQSCRSDISYTQMNATMIGKIDVAQPPVSVSPLCDDYYKSCVENTTSICVCADCEYISCLYDCDDDDPTPDPDDDPDTGDPTTDTDYDIGPKLTDIRFTDSAYDIPIPIIYGRYVIAGNIIWAAEPTLTTVTERTESVDEKRIRVQISERSIYHGSFAVGLCEGPISGLVRVWLGETLLFSKTIAVSDAGIVEPTGGVLVDEIENMLLFSGGSDDQAYYDQTRMRLSLFTGAEDQLPAAVMGANAPAYRGLAYLVFENVNLSYLGGNVPQLRIEVSQFTRAESFPRIVSTLSSSDLDGARPDMLYADIRSNALYVAADPAPGRFDVTAGFRKLRYDTLEEISYFYDGDGDIDPSTFAQFPNGIVAYQHDNGNLQRATRFVRTETNTVLDVHGYDADATPSEGAIHLDDTFGALSPATLSTSAYQATSYGFDERLFSVDMMFAISTGLSYTTAVFDEETSALQRTGTIISSNDPSATCYEPCVAACGEAHCTFVDDEGGGSYTDCIEPDYTDCLDQCDTDCFGGSLDTYTPFASVLTEEYYLPDPAVEVYKRLQYINVFTMKAAAQPNMQIVRITYGDTAESGAVITNSPDFITVPASVWGGQSSGVSGLFVIDDRARQQAVVFLADGAGGVHAFALNSETFLSVNWYVHIPDFPAYTSNGARMLAYPADVYMFIDGNGDLVGLDLSSGQLKYSGDNIIDEGLPAVVGPQLYDPGRNAITYVAGDSTVVRVYPQRTIPDPVPISDIISDICARVGIDRDLVDVSDLVGFDITGVGIFENMAPADVIEQFINMFALSVIEQDGKIIFRRRHIGDDHTLDESEMIIDAAGNTYERVEVDTYVEPKKFTLTYADIENFCRAAYQMVSQPITPQYTVNSTAHVKVETAAALTPAMAIGVAERMYARLHSRVNQIKFAVPAVVSLWAPNDYVTITFPDSLTRRYRITDILFDPTRGRLSVTAEDDVSHLSAEDMSIIPWEDPAKYRVQQAFQKLQAQTIRVFTPTPFTDADMLASTTHHVFYVGIQSTLPASEFPPTGVSYKVLNGYESVHESGPDITESLKIGRAASLLPADTGEFDTDTTTQFTVQFIAGTPNFFTSATKSELLQDRTRNCLLVGREWLQYQTVDYTPATGVAIFSGLFRGRNGSDTYVFRHNIGEEVIVPTPGSFKPIYVHYQRMPIAQSLSVRLKSLQSVQVSGKPVVFATNTDSIRPWAPANADRYVSNTNPADVVVTFAYRGKHDDDDLVVGGDVPTFQPTPEIYGENRDVGTGSYSRRFVAYFTKANDDYSTVEAMIRGREENLQSVLSNYYRTEAGTDAEAVFPSTAMGGSVAFNPAVNTLYVYVAQIGGPANNKVGFITKATFPPGTYPSLPLGPKMRTRKLRAYAVISPDNIKLYDGGVMLVLKP